jgi:radical SAM protein (TIGR04043 family)
LLDGFPVNAPIQSPFATQSPYSLGQRNGSAMLCRDGQPVIPAQVAGRPKFYDRFTDQGVPYHHIALLHGRDCLASTVLQTCLYWDTPKRCAFCGIELSLEAGQTIARKTPAQLAEVVVAARDLDGVSHVVLTTGTGAPPGSEVGHLADCTRAIKQASGLPVHVQFMPPPDLDDLTQLKQAGVDTVGIHIESFDRDVLARLAPPKAALGLKTFRAAWRQAVELFGPNQVSSFLIAGLGESPESILEGCRYMADMGVYPFLVPHRPIPGSRLADHLPPAPDDMNRIYAELALILASRGLSANQSKAGCVRCGPARPLPPGSDHRLS